MPKSKSEALAKRAEVVQLHNEGHTFDEIAARVGYANRGTAYRALMNAFQEREFEGIDEIRARELVKYDQADILLWDIALNSPSDVARVRAVAQVVNVSRQRTKILGLNGSKPRYGGGAPVVFDIPVRALRKPYTCRLNEQSQCGFDPELHGTGCTQPLAGKVLDPKFQTMGRTRQEDSGPAAQTQGLDHRPDSELDLMA